MAKETDATNGEDEKWKSVALMLVVGNICVFGGHSYAAAHPGGAARRPARATPGASSLAKARERVASDQTVVICRRKANGNLNI